MGSRAEAWLARIPFPPLRDVVAKRPATGPNIDALDGIRGLAVLLVLASHTRAFGLERHGGVGVWLFFALSAFLLTLPLADRPERATRGADLRRYAARRLGRIVPAYYVAVLVTFFAKGHAGAGHGEWLARHLAFLQADGILWTIPQELLFYALLPLLVAFSHLALRDGRVATIAFLAALATLSNFFLDETVFALDGNWRQMRFFLGIFATGMAFAYAWRDPRIARFTQRPAVNAALLALGLVILLLLFATSKSHQARLAAWLPWIGTWPAPLGWRFPGSFGALCGALVFLTLACRGRLLHRIFSSPWLRAFGIVSFSLYLFHLLVMEQLIVRGGLTYGTTLFAATLGVTYAVACVSYTAVERPFMRVRSGRRGTPGGG